MVDSDFVGDARGGAVGWRVVIKAGDVLEAARFYKHALALEEILEGAQGKGAQLDEGAQGEGAGMEGLEGAFVRPGGGDSRMRDEDFGTGDTEPGGALFEEGTVPGEMLIDEKEEKEEESVKQGEGEGGVGETGKGEGEGEGDGGDKEGEGEILYFPQPSKSPESVTLRGDAEGVVLLVIKGGGSDETIEKLRLVSASVNRPVLVRTNQKSQTTEWFLATR